MPDFIPANAFDDFIAKQLGQIEGMPLPDRLPASMVETVRLAEQNSDIGRAQRVHDLLEVIGWITASSAPPKS